MAAALAKVVSRGRCVASSRPLLPAILPHLGSSPATPAAATSRLMHTGLFRARGARPQEQLGRMERLTGKPPYVRPHPSFVAVGIASVFGFVVAGICRGRDLHASRHHNHNQELHEVAVRSMMKTVQSCN